jgi:hypothetical protein
LAAEATSVVLVDSYGREIREFAARREIIAAGEDLIDAGHEPGGLTARLVATGAIDRLDEIVAVDGRAHATRFEIGSAADDAVTQVAALMQNPGRPGVSWAFASSTRWRPSYSRDA